MSRYRHWWYPNIARERKLYLKQWGQLKVMKEQNWTEDKFREEFGKSYLGMRTWRGL